MPPPVEVIGFWKPWRIRLANLYAGALLGCVLLMVLLAAVLHAPGAAEDVVAGLLSVNVAGYTTALVILLCYNFTAIVQRMQGQAGERTEYYMFLTHDKSEAAAQGRLLKMLLLESAGGTSRHRGRGRQERVASSSGTMKRRPIQ